MLRTPMRPGVLIGVLGLSVTLSQASAAEVLIYSDRPNTIAFEARDALYVRLMIETTDGATQPCIDELEVYGPGGDTNLALAASGAAAEASSCLAGYSQHAVENLNDGRYGNAYSWIALTADGCWAQVKLAQSVPVSRVVFSRDRLRQYGDRVPTRLSVALSEDGTAWTTVAGLEGAAVDGSTPGAHGNPPALPAPPPPPRIGEEGISVQETTADPAAPRTDELGHPNLALGPKATAQASSVYAEGALPIHQVRNLRDGHSGNDHSWISNGDPSWAQIDLGAVYWVYRVAFGSDNSRKYGDRAATTFRIETSAEQDGDSWHTAFGQDGGAPVQWRSVYTFSPVQARRVRVAIESGVSGPCRIDEVEVYGDKEPITPAEVGPLSEAGGEVAIDYGALLREAFVGEEHAWLKTYGRADLDPSLVPYNGRVTEYPRHVADDRLPLPPIPSAPRLDGRLEDDCWSWASRGVARVAAPADFAVSPLVCQAVSAGVHEDSLYLGFSLDCLLSSHVALISTGDWMRWAILAYDKGGLVLNTYRTEEGQLKLEAGTPIEAGYSDDLRCCEVRLPMSLLPGVAETGLRIGMGIGGRHTSPLGRAIQFALAPLGVRESGNGREGFEVTLSLPVDEEAATVRGSAGELAAGLRLQPGQRRVVSVPAAEGAIGPSVDLAVVDGAGRPYELHLFRYDPTVRVLSLMEEMLHRMGAAGLDVSAETAELAGLRERHSRTGNDPDAEREAFYEARQAKRRLFLKAPELAQLDRVLFVKRFAFHPSHIYTDYTDAPFRPGGGVYVLWTPVVDGRLAPERATARRLFDSGGGIARDPVADFSARRVYFSYRPAADGFYHVMAMDADGGAPRQLTDGPFHDLYPLPLPDGGLGFISTRCTARVFCFRGPSSVLFRMEADGSSMQPLSLASLSEWAPSVMRDGRILWTRWEYVDKGADFTQTLWAIRPDGTHPELVFGNTIVQPNGYACGRQVPDSEEILCTLVSHFGDINGPLALLDPGEGRMNPQAIRSITPEVPWPGMWPATECFRDPVPLSRDYFLCSHAPADRFGLFVADRYGNRELLHSDPAIGSMAPTVLRPTPAPPVLPKTAGADRDGQFVLVDVYRGLEGAVARGAVKYLRLVEELRHDVVTSPNKDHADFMKWYAGPVDIVSGPYGWPAYVAKAPVGIVPVDKDGSAKFRAPAGKVLYFQALDADYNELQRMRSVVQLQPGESRACVGCHESRSAAPPVKRAEAAVETAALPEAPPWGAGPFSYEKVVQPVLDRRCVSCHDGSHPAGIDLRGTLDPERVPASYRTLISRGLVHVVDCGWNSGGCEKRDPMTFGTLRSRLWAVLGAGHHQVSLTEEEMRRVKEWTDLNCPLWPDYVERSTRPAGEQRLTAAH